MASEKWTAFSRGGDLEGMGVYSVNPEYMSREDAFKAAAARELYAALEAACQQAEGAAIEKAVSAGLGVSEWEALAPPWFSSARAALAQARGEDA